MFSFLLSSPLTPSQPPPFYDRFNIIIWHCSKEAHEIGGQTHPLEMVWATNQTKVSSACACSYGNQLPLWNGRFFSEIAVALQLPVSLMCPWPHTFKLLLFQTYLFQVSSNRIGVPCSGMWRCVGQYKLTVVPLTLRPWRWRQYVPPKRRWTYTIIHAVTSQKTVLSIVTVRTSNPANWDTVSQEHKSDLNI
jgi:hypothetical protein